MFELCVTYVVLICNAMKYTVSIYVNPRSFVTTFWILDLTESALWKSMTSNRTTRLKEITLNNVLR